MSAASRELRVITRDQTHLVGDLWQSALLAGNGQQPVGIVVIRTPYDARQQTAVGRSWALRGFHCLIHDVRGRYRSGGEWQPYRHEGADGADVITELRRVYPGLPIITFGASYAAHTALEAARSTVLRGEAAPEAVIALVPALGLAETAFTPDGQPQLKHRIGWWHEHGQGPRSYPPLTEAELDHRTAFAEQVGPSVAAREWGWSAQTLASWDAMWRANRVDLAVRYACVTSPLLVISGDHDFFDADAKALAAAWPAERRLLTGPWGHQLAHGLTDQELRQRLRDSGGIGGAIDDWLSRRHHPSALASNHLGALTLGRFDAERGEWEYERNVA